MAGQEETGLRIGGGVVGVIGHVDHGKTALVRAMTGIETDRLPEERERGISIALGFAHLPANLPDANFPDSAGGGSIDLIDMPGHERFVRTMVAGASGIDAVLLVVAANEGVMPQTREHADIAGLLGIGRGLVVVTKADLVDEDTARLVGEEAADLLRAVGIAPEGILLTSATSGAGIAASRAALVDMVARAERQADERVACLAIDRAFAIAGHGPVVTGTLRGGAMSVGQELELWPGPKPVRVRSVQVHGGRVDAAAAGQRVALNLRGVEVGELGRGMMLAEPGALAPSEWLTVALRAVADAPDLPNGMRLEMLAGAAAVPVRLRLLDRDVLVAGEQALAQLRCAEPVAVPVREPLVLRVASPARTVAGGLVLEPVIARRKRMVPGVLARLAALRDAPGEPVVRGELKRGGARGVALVDLARLAGWPVPRLRALLSQLPVEIGRDGRVMPREEAERRRKLAPRMDEGRRVAAQDLAARIADTLRQGGLSPPAPREIVVDPASRHAVDRLLRDGTVVRAVDRAKGKEILFHADAIAEARRRLAPALMRGEGLLVTEIGAALDISRKYSMPLVDHLDTIGFTRRIGDRRVLARG